MMLLKIFIVYVFLPTLVKANGRFLEPPCRSSIWRFAEFKSQNPPVNYNDNHVNCGGALVAEDAEEASCGICGDPVNDPTPRSNEDGGQFSKKIIVRQYAVGQKVPVTIQLTYGQKGYFEFSLCTKNDAISHLDESCYSKNILEVNGKEKMFPIVDSVGKYYNLTVQLPNDVTCSNCVLRWKYRTGNNWGICGSGPGGALGCGPQSMFFGCSDISILN